MLHKKRPNSADGPLRRWHPNPSGLGNAKGGLELFNLYTPKRRGKTADTVRVGVSSSRCRTHTVATQTIYIAREHDKREASSTDVGYGIVPLYEGDLHNAPPPSRLIHRQSGSPKGSRIRISLVHYPELVVDLRPDALLLRIAEQQPLLHGLDGHLLPPLSSWMCDSKTSQSRNKTTHPQEPMRGYSYSGGPGLATTPRISRHRCTPVLATIWSLSRSTPQ